MDYRGFIYEGLTGNAALTARVPAASIYPSGSLEAAPQENLFIVIRMLDAPPGPFAAVKFETAEVWVHHRARSYHTIDEVLKLVKNAIEALPSSEAFITAEWEGSSVDLEDEAFGTNCKNGTIRLVGRNE